MGRGGDPEDAIDAGCAAGPEKRRQMPVTFTRGQLAVPLLVMALDDPGDLGKLGEGEENLAVARLVGRADAQALPRLRTDPAA